MKSDDSSDLTHTRSCPMLNPMSDDFCTCGLEWHIRLRTEMEMHNAWRKRAEEAESALAATPTPATASLGGTSLQILLRDVIDHFRGDFGESVGEQLYGHGPGSEVSAGGQWLDRWLLRAEAVVSAGERIWRCAQCKHQHTTTVECLVDGCQCVYAFIESVPAAPAGKPEGSERT